MSEKEQENKDTEDVKFGEDNDSEQEQGVKDWAENNFKAVKKRMKKLQTEMRNNKPQENINVRKVDTEDGPKIVVEYSVQRWYSPKYFKTMLEDEEDEDVLFN